jgi:hypothetical protein
MTADHIKNLAHGLAERLKEDIQKAGNREDHIRISARANEADLLVQGLNQMFDTSSSDDDLQENE